MGGSTCRSGPGGLLPSRFAGHPRGCAPSTGAQGIRPRSHREIRALALGPSHDGNGASLAGSAGSCPDPAPYGPWPRRARLAHPGLRRGTAGPRDAGGARLRCPPPHPLVMLGEDLLGQVPISRRPRRKPRQGPLVRQSVRHGADGACRPHPRFRRRGGNQCEASLLLRAGYLGQLTRVPVATGRLHVPGVGAPIRRQGTQAPLRPDDLLPPTPATQGALLPRRRRRWSPHRAARAHPPDSWVPTHAWNRLRVAACRARGCGVAACGGPARRGTRVMCPAAPSAVPHRPAPHGLSAGDRSCTPLGSLRVRAAPLAAKRPLRHPRISPASALVRIRCCRRSSRASNCSGLTSCRTRARVLVALLEGSPLPGQISGYKNRTDDALSTEPFHKS